MDVGQIAQLTEIKKKINSNIGNVYILVVSILSFVVFLRILREVFSVENYLYNIYLLIIFAFIIGTGFIIKKTPLVVLTGFLLLTYATWLYYSLYKGKILENEAIGHYIWFIAIPIAALISTSIKKNLDEINENLERERKEIEKYSTRDAITGFRNKKEALVCIDMAISTRVKRKLNFSVILISLQDISLLKEELGIEAMGKLSLYISEILKENIALEDEKFFMKEGEFMVMFWNLGEDTVNEKKIEIKNILKSKLETPKGIYGLGRIPFKISGISIREKEDTAIELYNRAKKGLEYDV